MAADNPSDQNVIARLDRIPVWPYSYALLWVFGAGYFFAFFDIVNIGAALPVIAKQFGISTDLASWAVTASLFAYIVGAYADGTIADLWGQRISLAISVALFTVGSIGAAFSFSIGRFCWFRGRPGGHGDQRPDRDGAGSFYVEYDWLIAGMMVSRERT